MSPKPRYESTEEVIAAAESKLQRTFAPEVWEYFEDQYYLDGVVNGEETLDFLIGAVRRFRRVARHAKGQPLQSGMLLDQHEIIDYRVQLVSNELAKLAAHKPYVKRFRKLHLPAGNVLPRENVGSWVRRHWLGPLGFWMVLVVDLDFRAVMELEDTKRATIDADVIRKALEAEEAGDTDAVPRITGHDRVAVSPIRLLEWPNIDPDIDDLEDGSALRDLIQAGEFLCRSYGWRKHQAIWFLLTGETPLLPMLMFDIRFPETSQDRLRIVLDIDVETSPDAVMSLYSDLRNRLLPGERRPLSRKMLALALFVDSTPESTWADRMRQWNDHCKQYGRTKWAYTGASNMARDYQTRTIKRLKPQYDFDNLERVLQPSWSNPTE